MTTAPVTGVTLTSADRDELIVEHWALVQRLVRKASWRLPPNQDRDDILSAAALALVQCAGRFNPDLGVPFGAFVTTRIKGAIKDSYRESDWVPRGLRSDPDVQPLSLHVTDFTTDLKAQNSASTQFEDRWVDEMYAHEIVQQALGRLSLQARMIIEATIFDERTLQDVGDELGLTESRICQIRSKALKEIRDAA